MNKDIPSKLYYSISEVADITGVKAHVLRYWESEFPTLRVKKSRTGSRRYRRVDIDEVLAIKELLYERGFKIAGARKVRRQERQQAHETEQKQIEQLTIGFDGMAPGQQLAAVSDELKNVLELVRGLRLPGTPPTAQKELKKKAGEA